MSNPFTDHRWRIGQMIVNEVDIESWVSRKIAWGAGSPWTHAQILTRFDELTEATFPRVRNTPFVPRLQEFMEKGQRFRVLEYPFLTAADRVAVAEKARSYVGRWYDVPRLAQWLVLRGFRNDGTAQLICSRLMTASHRESGFPLFPVEHVKQVFGERHPRYQQLIEGYATPEDLLSSVAVEVYRWEPEPNGNAT